MSIMSGLLIRTRSINAGSIDPLSLVDSEINFSKKASRVLARNMQFKSFKLSVAE